MAILQLIAAVKWPGIARISFFLLFAWASWTNWKTSQQKPQFYLDYADLAWSEWYRTFIHGWFAENINPVVGFIATCQGLIAISMLLKVWIFKIGSIGAIVFLISILQFGVGSGFPCTATMSVAIYILLKTHNNKFVWERRYVPYVPPALIDKRIKWVAIDSFSSNGTFTNGANTISATLYFNEADQLINLISDDRTAISDMKQYCFSTHTFVCVIPLIERIENQ